MLPALCDRFKLRCFISTPLHKVTLRVKCYLDVGRVLDTH